MTRTVIIESLQGIGETVRINGWIQNIRKMGKITFVDVRDRSGTVQCVYEGKVEGATVESAIEVVGKVIQRPDSQVTDSPTGSIEIAAQEVTVLNRAEPLPIPVEGDGYDIKEEMRLKYRYLDLRRDRMAKNMRLRSELTRAIRDAFYDRDFIEVETPILSASTKEGARDFVVPSRLNPGRFYALPQSPQQHKQILMSAGVENYFQVARCIRDEDLRADRGFEFTQVDMEMSFVTEEDVISTVESIVIESVKKVGGKIKEEPFPRIPYDEAIKTYGDDKFDLRTEQEKKEGILSFAWVVKFPFFKKVDSEDVAETRDGKSGWTFTHNPFSAPAPEHEAWHLAGENIGGISTQQYDLVCNGYEVGGGSIRAHKAEIVRSTYKIMGYTDAEIESSVGHMLKAFDLGTPPHGGIALGLDRLVMLLNGEESLKESIAFPMTYNGRTSVMEGPGEISEEQMKELGLLQTTSDSVKDRVLQYLESHNVSFTHLEHEPAKTSEETAEIRGTNLEEGAKALILKGKKSKVNYMIVVPAHLKLDTKAAKQVLGEEVEFEKPDKIKEVYDLEVVAVPPFGVLLGMETFYDNGLFGNEMSNFNIGTRSDSVNMKSEDFRKLINDNLLGDFSK